MTNNVNWADVIEEAKSGGGSFEPIPNGDYTLLVAVASASTTQNGKPMYTIETVVQGGPHNNRKIWDRLVVSADNGRAMGFFFRKMKAIGLPVEFFQSSPTDDQIVQALTGRIFTAKVGLGQPFGGKPAQNEIVEYYAPVAAPGFPGAGAPASAPVAAPAPGAYPPPAAAPAAPPAQAFPPAPQAAPAAYPQPQAPLPPAPAAAPPAPPAPASPWETAGTQAPPTAPF